MSDSSDEEVYLAPTEFNETVKNALKLPMDHKVLSIYFLFIKLFLLLEVQSMNLFPNEAGLMPLLKTQKHVIGDLLNIIQGKKKMLEFTHKELDKLENKFRAAGENNKTYFQNPINKFLLVKRLTVDMNLIAHSIFKSREFKRNALLKYPDQEDFEMIVRGLSRLQRFYRLNVTQLAAGLLNTTYSENGNIYTEHFLPMTAGDCFRIGEQMYKMKFVDKGVLWFIESLRIFEKEDAVYELKKVNILEAICGGYHALGNSKSYIKWAKKLIASEHKYPNKFETETRMNMHESRLNMKRQKNKMEKQLSTIDIVEEAKHITGFNERELYRRHCRNEINVAHEISKQLKCWYFREHHPFLRLAPIKAEQLFIKPDIFLYHDVISDREIQQLKEIATPELEPLEMSHLNKTMTLKKTMFIRQCVEMEISERQPKTLNERISDFTGLLSKTTNISVTNYGTGGHFYTHYDGQRISIFTECKKYVMNLYNISVEDKNRTVEAVKAHLHAMETVVFYLSDVEQGGATVFPLLGVTIFPKKGAALVFTNRMPLNHGDWTWHGACPVLRGSKWVATKWINHDYQKILKRPCIEKVWSRRIEELPAPIVKS